MHRLKQQPRYIAEADLDLTPKDQAKNKFLLAINIKLICRTAILEIAAQQFGIERDITRLVYCCLKSNGKYDQKRAGKIHGCN